MRFPSLVQGITCGRGRKECIIFHPLGALPIVPETDALVLRLESDSCIREPARRGVHVLMRKQSLSTWGLDLVNLRATALRSTLYKRDDEEDEE